LQRNPIMATDIIRAISDEDSLKLFTFLATEKEKNTDTNTLISLNGLTKKQFYLRMQNLIRIGIVKRNSGVYHLTSFGQVIYFSKIKIDAAIKNYWALKVVDSFESTREISSEVRKKLINSVVRDKIIKEILLGQD
jgi:predicted transcriptional regulator